MHGYYRNALREDYGNWVYGPDFEVIGQGEYSHVTPVEVKNPVGSNIEKASCNGYRDIVNPSLNLTNTSTFELKRHCFFPENSNFNLLFIFVIFGKYFLC